MPQLRIHFTDADIARTRLKLEIDPMWEVISSVQVLQHSQGGLAIAPWRRRVRERMGRDNHLRAAVETLMTVAPHAAYFPDFLTPALDLSEFGEGVEAVLSTPPHRLREEVGRLEPASGPAATWLAELARGKSPALRHLREALRVYIESALAPDLPMIEDGLRRECAGGIERYLRAGPEGLLRWLGPPTTWEHPVLTVDYPLDRDLHLDGRGLVLTPSYFCLLHPVALADPSLRPVLVFPMRDEFRLLAGDHGSGHLGALLGATRAEILRSVVDGSTTTRLARLTGVAAATVSHHTAVLRNSGLITTERHENFATHLITPLGLRLLTAGSVDRA
ncbi:ArsR/SmtB family transcription factor [Lentzea sp. NPDC059081]|uniref:ArsR/SmtB family transcription factor n=1 Tax=Lentzea sp. NPDC059081 TaxID=3346719 RepID=UPI00367A8452